MWHFVKKFDNVEADVEFTLFANEIAENVFIVLNGRLSTNVITYTSNDRFAVQGPFNEGDVLECYSILPMTQPDRFSFNRKEEFLSKSLARLKRLEYGIYETDVIVEDFSLFHTDNIIIENALKNKEIIIVEIDNSFVEEPKDSIAYQEEVKNYVAVKINNGDTLELGSIEEGDYLFAIKEDNVFINLIKQRHGLITQSAIIDNRIVHENNYSVFRREFNSTYFGFNDLDFCGPNRVNIRHNPIEVPMNPRKLTSRAYNIHSDGVMFVHYPPTSPSVKSRLDFVSSDGSFIDNINSRTDITPGILTHTVDGSLSFGFAVGFVSGRTDPITNSPTTHTAVPLPDFEIPVRTETTNAYFAIDIITDNKPHRVLYPTPKILNLIGEEEDVWDVINITNGYRYVTKMPIFNAVNMAIPMSWTDL